MEPFVHLGARSDFSIGGSLARVEQLCRLAARDGQGALALVDTMTLAGLPAFGRTCRRMGLRGVMGAEVLVRGKGSGVRGQGTDAFPMRVLAASGTGWKRLVQLLNGTHAGEQACVAWEELLAEPDGLLFLPGGKDSQVTAGLLAKRLDEVEELMNALVDRAGADRVFVALPTPTGPTGMRAAQLLAAVAEHFGLCTVAVPDVRYALPEDEFAWRVWRSGIGSRESGTGEKGPAGTPVSQRASENEAFAPGVRMADLALSMGMRSHLLSVEEANALYALFPGAVENASRVANLCEAEIPVAERRFPRQEFERGVDAESYIWNEIFARASQHYGDLPARWRERLNREFRDLIDADLADALVCLSRLDEALREKCVLRGPGAGFLTNSLVASLLGITRLDPLRYDLPFSLPEGPEQQFPRIELLIAESGLAGAGEALSDLFRGHVCPVGKWHRWTLSPVLDRLMKQVNWQGRTAPRTLKSEAWDQAWTEAGLAPEGQDPPGAQLLSDLRSLAWIARRIEGRARRLRPVANEYVFSVGVLNREIPCSAGSDGAMVSQWEARDLEALGYGRIAFGREAMLDVVDEAARHLALQGRPMRDPSPTPTEDERTWRLLGEGHTQGIRLFEGPGLRRRLRQIQPTDVAGLLRAFRAGAAPARNGREAAEFEEVLLALWCAETKALEPEAFYAAALTQAAGEQGELAALVEEARGEGLRIRPLDINCSGWGWAPDDGGLRPGFVAVSGMTLDAACELEAMRREMAFNDLADVLKRTDPRVMKTGQVEALIRAGALDSLADSRRELLANLPRLDQLLRPRKAGAGTGDPLQFFGHGSDWWLENQILRSEWVRAPGEESLDERVGIQRAATGQYLESDPLSVHAAFARAARLMRPRELANRDRGKSACLAAPINAMHALETPDGAEACLVELAGGCQAEVRGTALAKLRAAWRDGDWVLVAGAVERDANQWIIAADVAMSFEEGRSRATHARGLFVLPSDLETRELKELLGILKTYPGSTAVRVQDAGEEEERLLGKIASRRVTVCPGLESALMGLLKPGTWRVDAPEVAASAARAEEPMAAAENTPEPVSMFAGRL